jgi:hypothetical protein
MIDYCNNMNWYKNKIKQAWNTGIPLMDQYSEGYSPPSASHRKDPRSLVNANPQFGGEKREGYPRDTSSLDQAPTESEKIQQELPGESTLQMDSFTGEGLRGDEFTGRKEEGTLADDDTLPVDSDSKKLDHGKGGPHNMGTSIFQKYRGKRIKGLNLI